MLPVRHGRRFKACARDGAEAIGNADPGGETAQTGWFEAREILYPGLASLRLFAVAVYGLGMHNLDDSMDILTIWSILFCICGHGGIYTLSMTSRRTR